MRKLVIEHSLYTDVAEQYKNIFIVYVLDDTKSENRFVLGHFETQEVAIDFCTYYMENKKEDIIYILT